MRAAHLVLVCGLAAPQASACGPSAPAPSASAAPAATPAPGPRSLYARLGGRPAIEAVVGSFVGRLASDPRVKFRFANSDVPSLTRDLIDFVCAAAGGSCAYAGREMRVLHASMRITEAEWDATVEALIGALDEFHVPAAEKAEVLGAIGGTKGDVVDPPADPPSGGELARIDAAAGDLSRFGASAEILGAAFAALRAGQRSYAEQLFSMAEVRDGGSLAGLASLFRAGAPPRETAAPVQLPLDAAPQPKGPVGSSDEDAPAGQPERASLTGAIQLAGAGDEPTFGVVTLTPVGPGAKRTRKRTPKQRVIEQRGREFAPRLMAVPVGSTVAFPNFDGVYHNVFSRSDARAFDLGIFKNGQARSITFDQEGIVRIGCNLHANMGTAIVVVKAPHYAVTDDRGGFAFRSLAPGRYELAAFTERSAAPARRTIEVVAGENELAVAATADLPAGPSVDKFGVPRGASR